MQINDPDLPRDLTETNDSDLKEVEQTSLGHTQVLRLVNSFPAISEGTSPIQVSKLILNDDNNVPTSVSDFAKSWLSKAQASTPTLSPRYFLKGQIGSNEASMLLDSGSNICLVNSHYLESIERREGRFPRSPHFPLKIEDHQHNEVPTSDLVTLPIQVLNTTIHVPFIVHNTDCLPPSPLDHVLLGANFIKGVQAELIWQQEQYHIRLRDRPDTLTLLRKESELSPLSSFQLSARTYDSEWSERLATVAPITVSSSASSTGATAGSLPISPSASAFDACVDKSSHSRLSEAQMNASAGPSSDLPASPLESHVDNAGAHSDQSDTPAIQTPTRADCSATPNALAASSASGVPNEILETPSPMPIVPDKVPLHWSEVCDLNHVPDEHRSFMIYLLDKHQGMLSLHAADVGHIVDPRFKFPLHLDPSFVLPTCKPYHVPPEGRIMIRGICRQWLELGLIEPSTSTGCSPIMLVHKKIPAGANDKRELIMKKRLVCDLRVQNRAIKLWPNKLPHIHHMIGDFKGSKVFSKFDLANAYQNVSIEESDRHHLTFITPDGETFQFVRMPYGLKNAPSFFQHVITTILAPLQGNCVIYLDDIVLHSQTIEQHKHLLEQFASLMEQYCLKISPRKCSFFQSKVEFVGFTVDGTGVSIGEDKVKAIAQFERPKSVKQCQAFLGLANWMARFIPNFQDHCAVISDLFKKDVKFSWSDACEQAFINIKNAIVHATQLYHPDFDREMQLFTDASRLACGAGLFQYEEDTPEEIVQNIKEPSLDHLQPIAFHSRKFSEVQRRYSTLEQEITACLDALHAFRYYLAFCPSIVIHTDAKTILWLLSYNFSSSNRKLERYSMLLLSYPNVTIVHLPGKDNELADALSRQYDDNDHDTTMRTPAKHATKDGITFDAPTGSAHTLEDMLLYLERNPAAVQSVTVPHDEIVRSQKLAGFYRNFTTGYLVQCQAEDQYCQNIIKKLQSVPGQENDKFRFHHGILVRKPKKDGAAERVVVPKQAQAIVISYLHSFGHIGYKRLHAMLSNYYWFPSAFQLCKSFSQGCSICQAHNRHKTGTQETTNMVLPLRVNHIWSIDFMTVSRQSGLSEILNVIDDYSSFVISFPCSSQKASQVAKALTFCFSILGTPEIIRADHGRSLLESSQIKKLCADWGVVRLSLGIPHQPTKNAKVERAHQSIRGILKALSEQFQGSFKDVLPLANLVFNSTPHRLGTLTPYEIYMGRQVKLDLPTIDQVPESLRDHMNSVKQRHKEITTKIKSMQERIRRQDLEELNRDKKNLQFSDGDIVLLLDLSTPTAGDRPKKEKPVYLKAPYLIRKRLNNLVVVENILDKRVRHCSVNHLKKLVSRGRIYQDLPREFQEVFGHPFKPWELLQDTLPADLKRDFTKSKPVSAGPAPRTDAAPITRQAATDQPGPGQATSNQSDQGSTRDTGPVDSEDSADEDDDSDDDSDEPVTATASTSAPALSSTPAVSAPPTSSPLPGPSLRDRLRSSKRQFGKATKKLFRRT